MSLACGIPIAAITCTGSTRPGKSREKGKETDGAEGDETNYGGTGTDGQWGNRRENSRPLTVRAAAAPTDRCCVCTIGAIIRGYPVLSSSEFSTHKKTFNFRPKIKPNLQF